MDDTYIVLVNNTKVIDCKLVGRWVNDELKTLKGEEEQVFYVMAKLPDKMMYLADDKKSMKAGDLFQISGEGLEPADVKVNSKIELSNADRSVVVTGTLLKHINDGSCD